VDVTAGHNPHPKKGTEFERMIKMDKYYKGIIFEDNEAYYFRTSPPVGAGIKAIVNGIWPVYRLRKIKLEVSKC